ncbi:uncharacterized protein [Antedon mediterranea]|uniref:uncharacterized protein n=1 Tax=Antedon mediterranea TaxID=105859 RepID=UPI003AF4A223
MSEENEKTLPTSPLLEQEEEERSRVEETHVEQKEDTEEEEIKDKLTEENKVESTKENKDELTEENNDLANGTYANVDEQKDVDKGQNLEVNHSEEKDVEVNHHEEDKKDMECNHEEKEKEDKNKCLEKKKCINEETGEVRHRPRKKNKKGGHGHRVTMTVTIAAAIPTNEEDGPKLEDMVRKKKRLMEAPKAQNYYHCSYYLLPDDTEPVKTDVVTFGMAAKIYTDHDSKVIKTWQEGHQTWVAWSHSQKINVTKDLLLKLFDHTLQLRIWESREKVSARARFDRPKVFRLPQAKPGEDFEDVGGVRSLVMKQSQSYIALQPKKSLVDRPLPQSLPPELKEIKNYNRKDSKGRQIVEKTSKESMKTNESIKFDKRARTPENKSVTQVHKQRKATPEPVTQVAKQVSPESMKSYKKLGQLAGTIPPDELKQIKRELKQQNEEEERRKEEERLGDDSGRSTTTPSGRRGLKDSPQQREARRKSRKSEQAAAALQAYIKQHGNIRIPVKLKLLFPGVRSITNRLDRPVHGIEDVFITVSLDGPLMSETLRKELNPLVIKIASATNLPSTPLPYDQLEDKCLPVFCMYKFMGEMPHITSGKEHGKSAYWEDTNVVLLGTMERGKLREYLNGPPLKIEVHDRDRKFKEAKLKPTLFGEDMEDDKIGNVGMVTGKRTLHNPFKERGRPWDPYGVAKFDLSQLLLGEKTLYMTSPIHCCPIPDIIGRNVQDKLLGVTNAVDGPKDEPLPVGHYLDVNSQLKVRIEIAYPLTTSQEVKDKPVLPTPEECPFSRLVYVFDYKNTCFLHSLEKLITEINASALRLDAMPEHVIKAALSTYKLSYDQQSSTSLDIVTGFQILDGEQHIFILEGLRDHAIKKMWETLPRQKNHEDTIFEAMYNSNLMFSERVYAALDVDLCRIRLHEPLSIIVQQPLLYIRDMVPRLCLEAIIRLDKLLTCTQLRELTKNDLFPSAKMILSLSREFGIPLTTTDFEELKLTKKVEMIAESRRSQTMPEISVTKRREWTPLDNYNEDYYDMIIMRQQQNTPIHNFLQENIDSVGEISHINSINRVRPETIHVTQPNGTSHNYSTQTLNSTEQARESLRQLLAKEPNHRFTYCSDYNSASVVPVDLNALQKEETERSKAKYLSSNGFVYPGVKSSLLSNEHPRKPDEARVTENMQPWEENILHANILKPTLDRDRYTWSLRNEDIDLYRKPHKDFGIHPPATIHLAGDTLDKEKRTAHDAEDDMWRERLIVDDPQMKFHRCATETELTYKGLLSSNQIDRLQGLLKDKPKKYGLLGSNANNIPALSVVNYVSVDTHARENGLLPAIVDNEKDKYCGDMPGPFDDRSWNVSANRIPIRDMEHSKFEEMKGHDFKLYHKERSATFKPQIQMLSKEERNTNLFRTLPPEALRTKSQRAGNECFRHPPPGIRPASIKTEFYYPDREQYWRTPCQRDPSNKSVLKT